MREQLRKLIDEELQFINAIPDCDDFTDEKSAREFFVRKLEAILAASPPCTCPTLDGIKIVGSSCPVHGFPSCELTSPPAVSVKPGWVCKDWDGRRWFDGKPSWSEFCGWSGSPEWVIKHCEADCLTDPWPDHPNGGPECLLEVK